MARVHSSATNKSQLEIPVDIRSRYHLSNNQLPTKLSEEVSERINKAYAKANNLQRKLDEKILNALASLDKLEDDELLSTDWGSLDNHFETIEREMGNGFEFHMPTIWTKRYAGSLLHDSERVRSYSIPKRDVPVYSFNSQMLEARNPAVKFGPSRSELYLDHNSKILPQSHVSLLQVTGETKQPHVRHVKSLNDVTVMEKRSSKHVDHMAHSGSSPSLRRKPDLNRYLSGVVSSHFDLEKRPLELFQDDTEVTYTRQPTFIDSDVQRSFFDQLDNIEEDVTPVNLSKSLPKVADKLVSHSRRRCCVGTQTMKNKPSAFQDYVELKRQLSAAQKSAKGIQAFHNQFKKYKFLKNVTIEEYTTYKQSIATSPSQTIGLISKTPLMKKDNERLLNTLGLKKTLDETSVTAASPSYSMLDLCLKPSRKFQRLQKFVDEKRKVGPVVAKNPSILLPTPDISVNFPQLQQVYTRPVLNVEKNNRTEKLLVPESYSVMVGGNPAGSLDKDEIPLLNNILRNAQSTLTASTSSPNQFFHPNQGVIHNNSESSLHHVPAHRVMSYQHAKASANFKPIILPMRFLPHDNLRAPVTFSSERKWSPTFTPTATHSEALRMPRFDKESHQLPKSETHLVLNYGSSHRLNTVADSKHMLALSARQSKTVSFE